MEKTAHDNFEEKLIYLAKLRAEAKKYRYLYERILPRKKDCSIDYLNMIKAEEALEKCLALTFDNYSNKDD